MSSSTYLTFDTIRPSVSKKQNGVNYIVGEFGPTSKDNRIESIEISYRACFKPALVRYFIDRLSQVGV